MTDILVIGSTALILVFLIILLIRLRPKRFESVIREEFTPLRDSLITQQGKIEDLPEKTESRLKEHQSHIFTELKDILHHAQLESTRQISSFQEHLSTVLGKNSKQLTEEFGLFKDNLNQILTRNFEKLTETTESKLTQIDHKVLENLNEGFKKTNETFNNVIERLAKIDEAQRKIDSLSTNVISLQDILTDKKSRGIFGEVQLHQILSAVFGDRNEQIYRLQYTLSNGMVADAALFIPEPTGMICIDSKFPLENFKRMTDRSLDELQRKRSADLFKKDIRKHIDDISSKYIIPGETSSQAIMFLPAEAIFAELHAYHYDLVDYSWKHRVSMVSPSTFLALLNTTQTILNDMKRKEYADIIQKEILKLAEDFKRYRLRWNNLTKHIDTVQKDVKEIHTSTEKITKSFDRISNVEIERDDEPVSQLKPGTDDLSEKD
ncbi:MAG: recombination protein RmuC [Candidatus Marinimicrobia bacterium]|jgi:DNA recombination protein RmuC|nr:recombination protein RmuC [Candidatus Neomarinimicrobiota bacterium]